VIIQGVPFCFDKKGEKRNFLTRLPKEDPLSQTSKLYRGSSQLFTKKGREGFSALKYRKRIYGVDRRLLRPSE
jgi:hypothetical protein